jgi:multiple sugar transport system substrate-binding protein
MRFQDGIYGVPWYTDAGLLYYRRDLLEKAGFSEPPKTWDELVEQAKKTQRDEGVQFGFVFQGAEYEGGVCNGLEYVWTHGGDVLDPNDPSKVVVESPESVAGLTTQRAMIEDGVTTRAVLQYSRMSPTAPSCGETRSFCATGPTSTPSSPTQKSPRSSRARSA